MIKNNYNTIELATIIAKRSECKIKVGCIIYDRYGIFAWGWNHSGDGYGMCAERHAISRANRARLKNAELLVLSFRRGKRITSRPCIACAMAIRAAKIVKTIYQNDRGKFANDLFTDLI